MDNKKDFSIEGYLRRMSLEQLYVVCQLSEEKYTEEIIALAKAIYRERLEKDK